MATKKATEREALLIELELHKMEFSTLRQEILQLIESQRQYLNLSIVTVGAGLGLSAYIAQQETLIVLLLFPFVFHILLWEMLRSMRFIIWISGYLLRSVIPRMNHIVNELGQPNKDSIQVLGWEEHISSRKFLTTEERFLSFLSPSSYFIPVLGVGVLVAAFLVVSNAYGHIPTRYETALVYFNLFLLIVAAVQIILINRSSTRNTKLMK
jgi:hypothetical protein